MSDKVQIGRLALREEGNIWSAYYALPDTMKESVFLGSIRLAAVKENPERKQAFMAMMRDIVSNIIEAETSIRPVWGGPTNAPTKERWGGP
jgi:hypothetical protein